MGGKLFKKIVKIGVPIAASFIPGIGPLGVALAGAGATKLTGGSWGDALKAGAMSGLGSLASGAASSAFSKAFPETASSLGIGQGGLGALADSAGSATSAGANFGTSGLTSGSYLPDGFSLNMGDIGSSAGSASGNIGQQFASGLAGVGTQAASGGTSGLANLIGGSVGRGIADIPVIGSLLDKGVSWAAENPIAALSGAGQLMSSYNTQQQAEQQAAAQAAAQQQSNANNLDAWRLVLNQKSQRSPVDMMGTDWNRYGEGTGEQQFFNSNGINQPAQMAAGGPVHTESDMTGPLRLDSQVKYPSVDNYHMYPDGQREIDRRRIALTRDLEKKIGRRLDEDEMQDLMNRINSKKRWTNEEIMEFDPVRYASGGPVIPNGTMKGWRTEKDRRYYATEEKLRKATGRNMTQRDFDDLMSMIESPQNFSDQELLSKMTTRTNSYASGGPVKSVADKVKSLEGKYPRKTGQIKGNSGGMADKVKAKLSGGEFVFPADVVSHLGDGNTDAGAKILQDMIAQVRAVKTKSTKQPKALQV